MVKVEPAVKDDVSCRWSDEEAVRGGQSEVRCGGL